MVLPKTNNKYILNTTVADSIVEIENTFRMLLKLELLDSFYQLRHLTRKTYYNLLYKGYKI